MTMSVKDAGSGTVKSSVANPSPVFAPETAIWLKNPESM